MRTKSIVLVFALVLVVGTGLPLAHAEEGSISITVDEDAIDATIDKLSESNLDPETGTQNVDFTVETAQEDTAVADIDVTIYYDGVQTVGEADNHYDAEYTYDPEIWEDGTYDDNVNISVSFARYGSWEAEVNVTAEDDYSPDSDVDTFSVDAVTTIESVDSASAQGQPGDVLDGYGDFDSPDIVITANHDWSLGYDGDWVARDTDSGEEITGDAGNQGYSDSSGNPVESSTYEIHYYCEIPTGHPAGTYDTDVTEGTNPTHTLENDET